MPTILGDILMTVNIILRWGISRTNWILSGEKVLSGIMPGGKELLGGKGTWWEFIGWNICVNTLMADFCICENIWVCNFIIVEECALVIM